jgi:hypothetical protein
MYINTIKYSSKMILSNRPVWRRGIIVIVSAYRTEDPGFESRQCERFLGVNYIAVLLSKLNMHGHWLHLRKINSTKNY